MSSALPPELADDLRQLEEIRARADALVAPLSADEFNRPGSGGGWSVGQCLDHLNVTCRQYLEAIPAAIERGRERGLAGPGPVRRGLLGKPFIRLLEPPVRTRFKAPKTFRPRAGERLDKDAVLAEFHEQRRRLEQCFEQSADLDLWRIKLASPALPLLRFSLGEAYQIVLAHDRRHLWQAERAARGR